MNGDVDAGLDKLRQLGMRILDVGHYGCFGDSKFDPVRPDSMLHDLQLDLAGEAGILQVRPTR